MITYHRRVDPGILIYLVLMTFTRGMTLRSPNAPAKPTLNLKNLPIQQFSEKQSRVHRLAVPEIDTGLEFSLKKVCVQLSE